MLGNITGVNNNVTQKDLLYKKYLRNKILAFLPPDFSLIKKNFFFKQNSASYTGLVYKEQPKL